MKAAEFARCFHSEERVEFVAGLPCRGTCGGRSPCENAHVGPKGAGMGRRGDYDQIAPLCHECHDNLHRGRLAVSRSYLLMCAEFTQAAWREHQNLKPGASKP
jgi:hypothetical protein